MIFSFFHSFKFLNTSKKILALLFLNYIITPISEIFLLLFRLFKMPSPLVFDLLLFIDSPIFLKSHVRNIDNLSGNYPFLDFFEIGEV